MKQEILPVVGMHCASCAVNIQRKLKNLPGIESCEVNYGNEKAKISYDPQQVSIEQMNHEISKLGYSLSHETSHKIQHGDDHSGHTGIDQSKQQKLAEIADLRKKALFIVPIAILVFVIMLWEMLAEAELAMMFPVSAEVLQPILLIFATVTLFWAGQIFVQGALRFVKYRTANMDTLVGIGTLTAYIYSAAITLFPQLSMALGAGHTYFDVTIVVIAFVLLGKYLESKSKLSTGEALEKLVQLQPLTAIVKHGSEQHLIAIEKITIGEIVIVKPGQKVPLDGKIISGKTAVDESMITGESLPVEKELDDYVLAGTINQSGSIEVEVTKVGSETILAQIINMVEEAQASKAPIQKLVDKVSAVFVPVVLGIAVLTFLVWILLGSATIGFEAALPIGFICFIGVLIIACPCALGLATPTAIIVSTGIGANSGILIKDAEHLEALSKAQILVFDKTGTLTIGKPRVTNIAIMDSEVSETKVLATAAAIELKSEHPIAGAIVAEARSQNIDLPGAVDFEYVQGKGVMAKVDGKKYIVGNKQLMTDKGVKVKFDNELSTNGTAIYVATENKLLGIISIADTLKPEAKQTVSKLKKLGLKIVMLTGDNKATAAKIALEVGIDDFKAEVLPQDKANIVKQLQTEGVVAMLGDGINDAPALAQANIGIAMGTGTDIAIESSGVTLLKGDLNKVFAAMKLSKLTLKAIKQNLFWAFIYNVVGIPIAAGVLYPISGTLLSPAIAGLAMAFSSVSVVLNSLRLKRARLD